MLSFSEQEFKDYLLFISSRTIYNLTKNEITNLVFPDTIIKEIMEDADRYDEVGSGFTIENSPITFLASALYRISRNCFLAKKEELSGKISLISRQLTATEIYYTAEIRGGLKINHGIGLIVGARVKMGKNCLLHQNVTLGDRHGKRPTLGDDVTIYPGSIIIGDINIGNNCIIGANSTVLKSVPDNTIVKGLYK